MRGMEVLKVGFTLFRNTIFLIPSGLCAKQTTRGDRTEVIVHDTTNLVMNHLKMSSVYVCIDSLNPINIIPSVHDFARFSMGYFYILNKSENATFLTFCQNGRKAFFISISFL